MKPSRPRSYRRGGNNIIEFTFLVPWYIFLFVGAYDFGFFSYSLIAAQIAASEGAMYCSTSSVTAADAATACGYALDQFRNLPNVGSGLTTCGSSSVTSSAPVAVAAASVTGADGNPATNVTVMYLTPQLIPIPGVLPGQLTINRTVQMRLRN